MIFRRELIAVTSASLTCLAISFAIAYLVTPDDFALFALATIPYAMLIGTMGLIAGSSNHHNWLYTALQTLIVVVFASYLWTLGFLGLLGFGLYFIEAFRVPFFYYWIVGGLAGVWVASYFVRDSQPQGLLIPSAGKIGTLLLLPIACMTCTLVTVLTSISARGLLVRNEPEVYLLPDGYVGPVLIVYDQPTGEPRKYEAGARVYEIPENGMLLTQFDPPQDVNPDLWYVDGQGVRTQSILYGGSCVQDIMGDLLVACIQGILRKIQGKDAPWHTFLVVGRLSEQNELSKNSTERINDVLLSFAR
jgi:hypothetical protein